MLNNNRVIIFFALLGIVSEIHSQELSHQVLVPVAGVINTEALSYSHTIGETAVEIFTSSDFVFTQGFQQPGVKFTRENPPPGTGVKVYPNPVKDYVNIEVFGDVARTFRVEVINISGTITITEKLIFSDMYWYILQIPVENLSKGLYFVRIMSEDGVISRTFKIEKM